MPFGLVVFMVAVGLAFVALVTWFAGLRRKELRAWACARGLSFEPSKDRRMDDRYDEFKCLRQGHSRYAYNIMRGDWAALPVTFFDYHYATGSGKNRQDHRFSAAVIASPIPLKPLRIRREGFADRVMDFFGLEDIDFESAEFSRTFHVTAPDPRWAYAVIHQRMMEYLLQAPEFNIQFGQRDIMVSLTRTLKPPEFEAAADLAQGMLERLPKYLVQQQGERG